MATDRREKALLYERCRVALGDDGADVLMKELSPNGWENVATKQDIETLRAATKQDIETLRAATKQDIERLDHKIEVLEHKLTAAFERGLRAQTKWFMLGNVGTVVVLVGWFSTVRP